MQNTTFGNVAAVPRRQQLDTCLRRNISERDNPALATGYDMACGQAIIVNEFNKFVAQRCLSRQQAYRIQFIEEQSVDRASSIQSVYLLVTHHKAPLDCLMFKEHWAIDHMAHAPDASIGLRRVKT
jgi:hypothetical protein